MSSEIKSNWNFKAMGGRWEFSCYPQTFFSKDQVKELFLKAELEVHRIENLLTDFRPSAFELINENAGISPVKVDQEILSLIQYAHKISEETLGAFDISIAALSRLFRKSKVLGIAPEKSQVLDLKRKVNFKRIIIDNKNGTVYLPEKEMKISLGGIGKGYAVDKAFQSLLDSGIVNFCVNGSGDLRFHSHQDAPRSWRVGIQNPFHKDKKEAGLIQLTNHAVATSGNYKNNYESHGKLHHHVIDPRSGQSTQGVVSSTVIAKTALQADTAATCTMLLGVTKSLSYLNQKELLGVIVDEIGKVHLSKKAMQNFGICR